MLKIMSLKWMWILGLVWGYVCCRVIDSMSLLCHLVLDDLEEKRGY